MANDSDLPGLLVLHARHRPDLWVLRHDTPYALMDTYVIFKTRIIRPSKCTARMSIPNPDFGARRQAELPPTTITPTGKTP
jgi:hypothetical protein